METYNLAYPFYCQALSHPERTALVIGDRKYDYTELATSASQIAHWIQTNFPAQKIHVGIFASRRIEAYTGTLGTLWAGKTYVPLHPKLPEAYLLRIIERSELSVLIIDEHTRNKFSEKFWSQCRCQIISPEAVPSQREHYTLVGRSDLDCSFPITTPVDVSPGDHAYLMFTSGSTGEPKGIAATIANVNHFLQATQQRYNLNSDDRFSQFNDLNWDPSVFDLFSAWGVGASVYVVPEGQLLTPAHFIKKHQLTIWYSIPFQINMMAQMGMLKPDTLPSLRLSLFVGEPLTRSAAASWQDAACNSLVENVYGPTETTVVCLGQPFSHSPACITPERDYVAIGTPYDGMKIAIVDPSQNFLGPQKTGELVICGPQVTPGYWRDPAMTALKFPSLNHPVIGESRWYLTGDQGYQDDKGCFHFMGRTDNQVQLHGKRIELEEIESQIREIADCEEVAILAWPIEDGLVQGLIGFLNDPDADSNVIKEALRKKLPSYMIPKRMIGIERLPRNKNSKIDRKKLREMLTT